MQPARACLQSSPARDEKETTNQPRNQREIEKRRTQAAAQISKE
jgi:hypothetical protein